MGHAGTRVIPQRPPTLKGGELAEAKLKLQEHFDKAGR